MLSTATPDATPDATIHAAPAVLHFHATRPERVLPAVDPALLQARPSGLMIEYTSRCNLRCRYCSKSNPGDDEIPGRDEDMQAQTLEQTLALIASQPMAELLLAGTGESTFHKDWVTDLPRLIQAGKAANPKCWVHLNSNLAMKYGTREFDVLAQLDGIVVSIDTADRELTRQVRAKSDLALITHNMLALKAHCVTRGLRMPQLSINVTLYEGAARGLFELVTMMAELPVSKVVISDMVELEAAKINGLRALNTDHRATFIEAVQQLQKCIDFVARTKAFALVVQPHMVERINAGIAQLNTGAAPAAAPVAGAMPAAPAEGQTKLCLQPWTRFTVAADGALFPCCVTDMPAVGHIGRAGQGIDGPSIRAFRQALLVGEVPPVCRECTNAPSASTAELQHAVRSLRPALAQ
jgi:MoaA/NifB/PqqE/SkfB family radical SAM enzyme